MVVNGKPPDEFIKICTYYFIVVYLLDCCHHSMNDDCWPSKQWRRCPFDRANFIEDAALWGHASPRDTETFPDKFKVISKFSEPKSTFLEIPTDFTIGHDKVRP